MDKLVSLLERYPDQRAAGILHVGFTEGFSIGYSGPRVAMESRNLVSARRHPEAVREKINKELGLGRVAGPFLNPPLSNFRVSPIGVVPKASGAFRLIHHLSWPTGNSVNDGIADELCAVKYSSFDEAVQRVAGLGTSTLLAKSDVKSAFRLLPVRPQDFCLLGFKMDGLYFVDKCLPMGAASAPALFESFSSFLEWALCDKAQCNRVVHYADDFLVYGPPGVGLGSCQWMLIKFQELCAELGVPLAAEKTEGPVSSIVFLGLEIDAVRQLVCIPQDKLLKLRGVVDRACLAKKMNLRRLQSIIGSLSFVTRAIPPGRAFLRRLINLTRGLRKPWHRVRITREAHLDLVMWQRFLHSCNGAAIFQDQVWEDNSEFQLFTDASGSQGCGGYFQGAWFQAKWPEHIVAASPSIAWMEFFPIVVAVSIWGSDLAGKKVIFRSDNEGVVSIINKQSSPCTKIMRLVRFFVMQCLEFNISFKATHIPGLQNEIADSLSRFQDSRFRRLAPGARMNGVEVPSALWNI